MVALRWRLPATYGVDQTNAQTSKHWFWKELRPHAITDQPVPAVGANANAQPMEQPQQHMPVVVQQPMPAQAQPVVAQQPMPAQPAQPMVAQQPMAQQHVAQQPMAQPSAPQATTQPPLPVESPPLGSDYCLRDIMQELAPLRAGQRRLEERMTQVLAALALVEASPAVPAASPAVPAVPGVPRPSVADSESESSTSGSLIHVGANGATPPSDAHHASQADIFQ